MNTQDNRFLQQIGNAKAKVGDVLARALFGEEIAQPETTVINNDGVYSIESGVNNGGRKGGLVSFINDARNGMLENSSQGFQAQNLYPDKEKGTGYRLGEVAGSALRLLDNPLVRGGIAYGLSKRMGDENPLGEALTAANLTRQNRLKDQLYRNSLEQQGIDTNGLRGFVNDDVYKNLSLNNYRHKGLDVKVQLETLKDTTKRAQLVNAMLNSGELDPTTAMGLMNQYGINITDLDTSNQTKLLPYRQYALKNGWNLGWANFGLKQEAADLKNQILKELTGETGKTQTVRVKSPDGKIGTIPIEQLKGAEEAGYQRL